MTRALLSGTSAILVFLYLILSGLNMKLVLTEIMAQSLNEEEEC
jgi:hypothetical protein